MCPATLMFTYLPRKCTDYWNGNHNKAVCRQSSLKLYQLLLTKGSTHSLKPEQKFYLPEPCFMNSHWQIYFVLHLNYLSNQPIPTIALVTDRMAMKRNITEFFIKSVVGIDPKKVSIIKVKYNHVVVD